MCTYSQAVIINCCEARDYTLLYTKEGHAWVIKNGQIVGGVIKDSGKSNDSIMFARNGNGGFVDLINYFELPSGPSEQVETHLVRYPNFYP